ncbi:MAG: flagellar assembly protein FliH [Steroidobacteraceae bacterium]
MSDPKRTPAAQAAAIERWSLPEVDGPVIGRARDERKSVSAEAARAAVQEHAVRGYEAGLAQAQAQMQAQLDALTQRVQQLDSVLQLLARPLQQLDAGIEKELLQLALAVGKQLARRELRIDPAQVIGIIRESLAQLSAAARDVRVHLHPDDAATVRERLAVPANERAWTVVEDPTLTRGGCIVRTETSQIDVRLESRVNAVIANALGEERAPERPVPASQEGAA